MKILNKAFKILFIFCFLFLSGCRKVSEVSDYKDFNKLIENKLDGEYDEAIAYDLRSKEECDMGHIKGFICIMSEYSSIEEVGDAICKVYSKSCYIFLMDKNGEDSLHLYEKLSSMGYKRVYYFSGGYERYINEYQDFSPEVGCDC